MTIDIYLEKKYHMLYTSLKALDKDSKYSVDQTLINSLKNTLDKLSAFGQLIIHIDNEIPLLRFEKSIGKFREDVDRLFNIYQEEIILLQEEAKFGAEDKLFSNVVDRENKIEERFKNEIHDLYLTNIQANEKLIAHHLSQLDEAAIIKGIKSYFAISLDSFEERFAEFHEPSLLALISEIRNNLKLLQSSSTLNNSKESIEVFNELNQWEKLLQKSIACLDSVKDINETENVEIEISTDISRSYYQRVNSLNVLFDEFVTLSLHIMKLVNEWLDRIVNDPYQESKDQSNLLDAYV